MYNIMLEIITSQRHNNKSDRHTYMYVGHNNKSDRHTYMYVGHNDMSVRHGYVSVTQNAIYKLDII